MAAIAKLPRITSPLAGARSLLVGFCLLVGVVASAAEKIPPKPTAYFNDYAGRVSAGTRTELNALLQQFERDTSNQIVVAIFPRRESSSDVADYTQRVAESWKVGQQGRNNGAVLFAFMEQREVFIQVGYGLEGSLPDALAKRIVETEIVPRFRAGDFDGGMRSAVQAMIAATKGEYRGTGRTVNQRTTSSRAVPVGGSIGGILFILFFLFVLNLIRRGRRSPLILGSPMRRVGRSMIPGIGIPMGGGGWRSSGGGFGGGGGGFSGGGGSFGGGGAGGRW